MFFFYIELKEENSNFNIKKSVLSKTKTHIRNSSQFNGHNESFLLRFKTYVSLSIGFGVKFTRFNSLYLFF